MYWCTPTFAQKKDRNLGEKKGQTKNASRPILPDLRTLLNGSSCSRHSWSPLQYRCPKPVPTFNESARAFNQQVFGANPSQNWCMTNLWKGRGDLLAWWEDAIITWMAWPWMKSSQVFYGSVLLAPKCKISTLLLLLWSAFLNSQRKAAGDFLLLDWHSNFYLIHKTMQRWEVIFVPPRYETSMVSQNQGAILLGWVPWWCHCLACWQYYDTPRESTVSIVHVVFPMKLSRIQIWSFLGHTFPSLHSGRFSAMWNI